MASNRGNTNDLLDMSKPLKNFMLHSSKVEILSNSLDSLNDNLISSDVDPERLLSSVLKDDGFLLQDRDTQDNLLNQSQETTPHRNNTTRAMNTERYLDRKGLCDLNIISPSSSNESSDLIAMTKSQTTGSESEKESHSSVSSRMFSGSDSDRSSSPESYNLLYQSFRVAAENQASIYEASDPMGKPHLELTTPKLERLKLAHQQKEEDHYDPRIECSSELQGAHPNSSDLQRNEENPLHKEDIDVKEMVPDSTEVSVNSCNSSPLDNKQSSAEKKITFADIVQKKSSPPPKMSEETLSLPELTTHWTEMISTVSHSNPGECEVEGGEVSPRRPLSLPIQLRHVTKPSARPFPTSLSNHDRLEKTEPMDKEGFFNDSTRMENWQEPLNLSSSASNLDLFDLPLPLASDPSSSSNIDTVMPFIALPFITTIASPQNNVEKEKQELLFNSSYSMRRDSLENEDLNFVNNNLPPLTVTNTTDLFNLESQSSHSKDHLTQNSGNQRKENEEAISPAEFLPPFSLCNSVLSDLVMAEKRAEPSFVEKTEEEKPPVNQGQRKGPLRRHLRKKARFSKEVHVATKTGQGTEAAPVAERSLSCSSVSDVQGELPPVGSPLNRSVSVDQVTQMRHDNHYPSLVYIRRQPLKPIHKVDSDFKLRKALEKRWPRLELAGVAGLTNIPPQIDVDSVPPSLHHVSPRKERDSISVDFSQKKGLVTSIIAAVDEIMLHFGRTRDPKEKKKLGNSHITPEVGHLILAKLCPPLSSILLDGLLPHTRSFIVGKVRNTLWSVIEAMTQPGPTTKAACDVKRKIGAMSFLTDSSMKFNAFAFGLLNGKIFEDWLLHINSREDIKTRLYRPEAFLQLASTELKGLFEELILAIQPLTLLPFNLDFQFEHNHKYLKNKEERRPKLTPIAQLTFPSEKDHTKITTHWHQNNSSDEIQPGSPPPSLASLPQPLSSLVVSPQSSPSGQKAVQASGVPGWSTGWSFNWMSSLALQPQGEAVHVGSDQGESQKVVSDSGVNRDFGNWKKLGQSLIGAFDKIIDKSMASARAPQVVEREMTVFKKSDQAVPATVGHELSKPPLSAKKPQSNVKRAPRSISLAEKN